MNQAVLGIPSVGPAPIASQVAVQVIGERFRVFGDEHGAGGGGDHVGAVGAGGGFDAGDGYGLIDGSGIANSERSREVLAVAFGGCCAVEGDGCGGRGGADHVEGSGDIAAGVLVERV